MDCSILSVVITGDNFTLVQALNACISALRDIVCGYSRISPSQQKLQRSNKKHSLDYTECFIYLLTSSKSVATIKTRESLCIFVAMTTTFWNKNGGWRRRTVLYHRLAYSWRTVLNIDLMLFSRGYTRRRRWWWRTGLSRSGGGQCILVRPRWRLGSYCEASERQEITKRSTWV